MSNDPRGSAEVPFVEQVRAQHPNEVRAALTAMNVEWEYATDAQKTVAAYAAAGANGVQYMKEYHTQASVAEGTAIDPSVAPTLAQRMAEEGITMREANEWADGTIDERGAANRMRKLQQEWATYEKNRKAPPLGRDGLPLYGDPCEIHKR